MRIRATLRYMAASEIASMIPPERMRSIKALDKRPVFKAFVVGHEGEARGNMLGVGNVVKRWFRAAVEKLHERIAAGIQLFHGHAAGTNDQAGRAPIGEVVGKRLMKIGERLSTVVACYIYPDYAHLPLDVASVEADLVLEEDSRRGFQIADVERVTGIALGNSSVETPGFAGATLLGQLQAFAKSRVKEDDLGNLTTEEIRQLIREAGLHPSDLFRVGEITADPEIREQIRENTPANREFAELRREARDAEKRAADLERQLAAAKSESAKMAEKLSAQEVALRETAIESARAKAPALFAKVKAERKLSEQQARFIEARLSRFSPKKAEEAEKEFDDFMDKQVDEFNEAARLLGLKVDDQKGNGGDGKPRGTEPPAGTPSTEEVENEYLDPAKNEFIKLD